MSSMWCYTKRGNENERSGKIAASAIRKEHSLSVLTCVIGSAFQAMDHQPFLPFFLSILFHATPGDFRPFQQQYQDMDSTGTRPKRQHDIHGKGEL